MARSLTIEVEEADRGNVIRVRVRNANGEESIPRLEVVQGVAGSANLKDKTRRRLNEIVHYHYPVGQAEKRAVSSKG